MNMIKDDWQLTKQCTGYNNEMLDVVEQFKKERKKWLSEGSAEREVLSALETFLENYATYLLSYVH